MDSVPTVDLTNCDREPIHFLGAIQPIGFLVALTSDWMVARASANLAEYLGVAAEEAIGRPVGALFLPQAIHDLRNRTAMLRGPDAVERAFAVQLTEGGAPFDVALHFAGGALVIEGAPAAAQPGDVSGTVRAMISRLDQCADLPAFFNEGARLVRSLLEYDRVMVYRFAADGSGEVVAEAARPGIGRFLGLHYPASDIPAQARVLYTRNLLRMIADVHATPVPVVPQLDGKGEPLDLSLSMLRSVSPIHIEYLKNMGVGASLSISIVVEGKLWGLFACHHYAPRLPSLERRATSELFAQMFSMRLESRERKQTVEFERRARDISDQLLGAVASDETLLRDPDWLADILTQAIPADGVAVWLAGNYAFSGSTPPSGDFRRIVRALNTAAAGRVFATDNIASLIDGADAFASEAAGLLAIPISRSPRDYVVLFRSELIRSVRWAGDPHKPVEYGPNGPRLTPRESFEEWKELVRGRSQPFSTSEQRVAETLRATLIEVVLRLADDATAQRQQASERQELLIAELNHRVRNILGVIRGLIRQAVSDDDEVKRFVRLVDGRIHALARAHNQITQDHWGPAQLQALIDAETGAFLSDSQRIVCKGKPVLLNPQAFSTMALVIHELVTNSSKYGSLSVPEGLAHIEWARRASGDLEIRWHETGGPPVEPPKRQGFGTTIIERSVPYDLGGEAQVNYNADGLEAQFRIPARHVSDPDQAAAQPALNLQRPAPGHAQEPPPDVLAGQRVLLVEDSLIIALDAEDILRKLGADEVCSASSVEAALELIDLEQPSVAILDINLGHVDSFPIADHLLELKIPFVFATGYGEQAQIPTAHRGRAVIQKPYTLEIVARSMASLLATGM